MNRGRLLAGACALAGLGAVLHSQGCGDNATLPVDFEGNVTSVETSASASLQPPSSGHTFLVRLDTERLRGIFVASAEAQSGACSAATQQRLADVLACVEGGSFPTPIPTATVSTTPTPIGALTPTGVPTQAVSNGTTVCSPVRSSDCTFSTRIVLSEDGQSVFLFFVQDTNGNGGVDAGERQAFLVSPLPRRLCNGDVIEIPDVDIDFVTATATAGGFITKQIDACPEPTGIATATPSRTTTPGAPSPTATGTPATPTPSDTPTPTPTSTSTPT
jgi:hypothetical protein